MIWKVLTILILIAAILGGAGFFVYETYLKPQKLDKLEQEAAAMPTPPPPPDPSIAAFEVVRPYLESDTPEARNALVGFVKSYPDSPLSKTAKAALGRINGALTLSPVPGPDKTTYTVVSGDSLVKIASKFKTGAELIYRANGLTTINLKIGQRLEIPQLDTAVVVDRAAGTVTVLNRGDFFREYVAESIKLPASMGKEPSKTAVSDKFMLKGSGRIPFGAKDYESGDRWIMLGSGGLAIRGMPAPGADGQKPPVPPGIVLSPGDAAELFVLVTKGTPVTINGAAP